MTAALLVLVAHGLDLVTLLAVAGSYGIAGEANPLARDLYAASPLALVALKVAGAAALALMVVWVRPYRWLYPRSLVAATGMGLAGALINAVAGRMG